MHSSSPKLVYILLSILFTNEVSSIVVSRSTFTKERLTKVKNTESIDIKTPPLSKEVCPRVTDRTIRIRKACHDDLDSVSSLLAQASIKLVENQSSLNWNTAMERLKAKSSLYTQLNHRLNTIIEGNHAMVEVCDIVEEDGVIINSPTNCRMVWSQEKFRSSLERAVKAAIERNVWDTHNFALVPDSLTMFQHTMITAEDTETGDIVGFCEVAMLPRPTKTSSYPNVSEEMRDEKDVHAPSIVNLVISPNHRRRGIGSSLIRTLNRYVRSQWEPQSRSKPTSLHTLGLYVESDNGAAIALYTKEGFMPFSRLDNDLNHVYFQKILE